MQAEMAIFSQLFEKLTDRLAIQKNPASRQKNRAFQVSEWRDSNPRPPAPKAGANWSFHSRQLRSFYLLCPEYSCPETQISLVHSSQYL